MESKEKQEKLEELKKQYLQKMEEDKKREDVESQMQNLLTKFLTDDAKQRLSNVRLVNQELYMKAFQAVMSGVQKGYVKGKITEDQLKEILMQLKNDREIKITRK